MEKIYLTAIIMLGALSLGAIGNAHAYGIDGEDPGVDKYTVTGFGSGDSWIVTATTHATGGVTPVLTSTDPAAVASQTFDDTTGLVDDFIHDFVFIAIRNTFASIEVATENVGAITDLVLSVWLILDDPMDPLVVDQNKGTTAMSPFPGGTAGALGVELVKDQTYVVRMRGGNLSTNPNYTLSVVSAVPVPAAVWLFGTAMLGLLGMRRKSKMAVAA